MSHEQFEDACELLYADPSYPDMILGDVVMSYYMKNPNGRWEDLNYDEQDMEKIHWVIKNTNLFDDYFTFETSNIRRENVGH